MRRFALCLLLCPVLTVNAQTIRSQAVVDLSLDSIGQIKDVAKSGKHADVATVIGKPQVISSPFWGQKGNALLLDAAARQYVNIPDSADVDRPKAVTVSTFFLSLHPLNDPVFRGLFGKRGPDNDARTNYGINFQPSSDAFQVYIHDGPGFKVIRYSLKGVINFSRLVHLTTTYEVADAPGADKDTDADDMRIRLFVNGRIVKPTLSSQGFVDGNDGWLTDIKPAGLLNDVPLTVGSSYGNREVTSGVYDEFLVFDKALTADEAGKLFVELTGATADQIAKKEQQQKRQRAAKPTIAAVMPRGLQIGATTRVTVTGGMLKDGSLFVGEKIAAVKVIETAGNRITADVTVPADVQPGFYPLRAAGATGVSNAAIIAIDRLAEGAFNTTSAEKPAALPAAFSGTIAGTQEARVWFRGTKGQRVVAEVEARRLGAGMDPVVEIKTSRGTPMKIEWRKHQLHGDTRAEVTLPTDGVYFAELHDLSYKAPGNSPFRMRIGDLKVIDRLLVSGTGGDKTITPLGTGLTPNLRIKAKTDSSSNLRLQSLPEIDGPLPSIQTGDAMEYVENSKGKQPNVDARFGGDNSQSMVAINGVIAKANERDVFNLQVTENTKLYLTLKSRSLGSPLDGTLQVANGKQILGTKNSGGLGNDVAIEVTVPKGVKSLQIRIGDFAKTGSDAHAYRLLVHRSGRIDFRIAAKTGTVEIPENGSTVLRLGVTRSGGGFAYAGPIRLTVEGDPGVQITPTELPEEAANRDVFVVLTRTGPATDRVTPLTILAESARGSAVRRFVRVPAVTPVVSSAFTGVVAAGRAKPVDASINVAGIPPILFRGTEVRLPIHMTSLSQNDVGTVRFKLLSTERSRDKKPRVREVPNQFVNSEQSTSDLRMIVPTDVADPLIDFVVIGELVDNPFAPVAKAVVYSAPIRLMVQTGVRLVPNAQSLSLKIGTQPKVTGLVARRFGFDGPVRVSIAGLPKGYAATAVNVAGNQRAFEIPVTLPKAAKPGDLKVQLVTQSSTGAIMRPNQPVTIKVVK